MDFISVLPAGRWSDDLIKEKTSFLVQNLFTNKERIENSSVSTSVDLPVSGRSRATPRSFKIKVSII